MEELESNFIIKFMKKKLKMHERPKTGKYSNQIRENYLLPFGSTKTRKFETTHDVKATTRQRQLS